MSKQNKWTEHDAVRVAANKLLESYNIPRVGIEWGVRCFDDDRVIEQDGVFYIKGWVAVPRALVEAQRKEFNL